MDLTIIVPFFNGHEYLDALLGSLPEALPILLIDDQSDRPLQEADVRRAGASKDIRIVRLQEKGWFTGAVNRGLAETEGDVLILNQDVTLSGEEWLNMLAEKRREYGLIGERISGNHPAWPSGYIHGTFMFIRRDVVNRVGLMDARHYPLWGSTCDYQLRAARRGFKALPLSNVPGFFHLRGPNRNYGTSIQQALKRWPQLKGTLIQTPPTISVVINTYQHGRYLTDAINSLIGGPTVLGDSAGQTFQGFEVIVVDDGSTDNTRDVMSDLAGDDVAIRYIHQYNQGSAAAMNTGIRAAVGRLIAPMDADDMMEPERLERLLAEHKKFPNKVIYDDLQLFDNEGFVKTGAGHPKIHRMPTYDFNRIIWKNGMHKGLLYPKKAWADAGGYPASMNDGREDWAFNVATGLVGWCGHHLEWPGYLYRRHERNRTLRNTTPEKRQEFLIRIMGLYPEAYGERPTMCCGATAIKQPKVNGVTSMGSANELAGADGMVKVVFNLNNASESMWYGHDGRTYRFGGKRKEGWIDKNDWPLLDDMWEGRVKTFHLVQSEGPKAAKQPSLATAGTSVGASTLAQTADDTVVPDGDPEEVEESAETVEESAEEAVDLSGNLDDLEARLEKKRYSVRALTEALEAETRKGGQELLREALENWAAS